MNGNLTCMYKEGTGCEANITKAVKWYKAAVLNNYQEAIEVLRRLKINETGI